MQRKNKFKIGDLVRVVHPISLKEMNVSGLIVEIKSWFHVWIPDIGREIAFEQDQLEKIEAKER